MTRSDTVNPAIPRRTAIKKIAAYAIATGAGVPFSSYAQVVKTFDTAEVAQQWRALSRLGYGPNAMLVQSIQSAASPKAWALQQLASATEASQRPPVLTADLAAINAPLPDIFDADRKEREARKNIKAGVNAQAEPDGLRKMEFSAEVDPLHFNRTMVQKAAAWRLTANSQPDIEPVLLARMTEFWFNHLNIFAGKGSVRPFIGHYVINVARAHAFGKFEDLLMASARHPGMLHYLDQFQSVAPGTGNDGGQRRGLNENYARELMELHTLGVNGGYSQTDVRELARILTGWTIGPNEDSGFRFALRAHDTGNKQLLGRKYPDGFFGGGEREGKQAIQMLARHPQTAQRISLRLAHFFVSDNPPAALVARLAATFLETQGDLRAVMNVLIESDAFWAPENRLFKTPMDFACSALVAVHDGQGGQGVPPDRRLLLQAMGFLSNAGQPLHGWQTPDGYATDMATWLAPEALTRRADFALGVARQTRDLEFLQPFLSATTRASIAQEKPALRAGLALASPEFMYK
jgi:uncharacterized protein (DUF1800 family)